MKTYLVITEIRAECLDDAVEQMEEMSMEYPIDHFKVWGEVVGSG